MNGPQETISDGSSLSEELIAYLDGELDSERRHRIEEQLSDNAALRQRLKELQQAWDLLDELPRDHVDDTFAKSTVEMVAIHAEAEVDASARAAGRWKLAAWCLGLAGATVAAVAGFSLAHLQLSQPNRTVVKDLPILEHLDAYQNAGSIDFLRTLENEGLFREEESNAQ